MFSPALLILPFPGLFRLTCYYYRGAYYKAFWADPPACAVGEPRKEYCGEAAFPLIVQNIHRYFLYVALVFLLVLAYDVYQALWFADPSTGQRSFGIGRGHAGARRKCDPAGRVHPGLSLAAPRHRRLSRPTLPLPSTPAALRLLQLLQPRSHAVGLDQSLLRGLRGPICPSLLDGGVDGLEDSVRESRVTSYESPIASRQSPVASVGDKVDWRSGLAQSRLSTRTFHSTGNWQLATDDWRLATGDS